MRGLTLLVHFHTPRLLSFQLLSMKWAKVQRCFPGSHEPCYVAMELEMDPLEEALVEVAFIDQHSLQINLWLVIVGLEILAAPVL